jgi:hypothetical protein
MKPDKFLHGLSELFDPNLVISFYFRDDCPSAELNIESASIFRQVSVIVDLKDASLANPR